MTAPFHAKGSVVRIGARVGSEGGDTRAKLPQERERERERSLGERERVTQTLGGEESDDLLLLLLLRLLLEFVKKKTLFEKEVL